MRVGRAIGLGLAILAAQAEAVEAQETPLARLRQTLGELDANHDQAIERDEVPESGRAAFDTLLKLGDTNKDGKLDAGETRALLAKARGATAAGRARRFQAMDKDGDGKLSRAEFTGPSGNFDRLDADKDGVLTRDEFVKGRPGVTPAAGAARPSADRLRGVDKDGDGKLSRDEFLAIFDRLDADKDGFLTPAEAGPAIDIEGPPTERFQVMDKDGDGKLSRAEYTGPPRMFNRLDANKDGFLTPEELSNGPRKLP